MPRLSYSQPAYRLHKSSGQAVVSIDGKKFYLGKYRSAASRERYNQLILEWMANQRSLPAKYRSEGLSIVELLAAYLTHAKDYYVKNGQVTGEYRVIVDAVRPLKELYGRSPAKEFGPLALEVVRNRMIELGWTRRHINKQVGRIIRMFRWGASREMFPVTVPDQLATLDGLRAGRCAAPDNPPVPPVSDSVVDRTLPHLPPVVADMVRLQRLTGARPSEVCDLRPCDIDRTGEVWLYRPASHKTEHHGKSRVICIGPQGQQLLRPYLLRGAEDYCFSPQESEQKRRDAQHAARKTPLSCGNRPGTNRRASRSRPHGDRYNTAS